MTHGDDQAGETRPADACVEALSAVTLFTNDLPRAVRFYRGLGFELYKGDERGPMVSFRVGEGCLNLLGHRERPARGWGRVIFHVTDVDAVYSRALALGLQPDGPPRDAPWGERYFHLCDPDGHELSFARPLAQNQTGSPS